MTDQGIEWDLLIWEKDKADAVINHVYPAEVVYFIEDRDKHALELAHIDVPVLLLDKSYNQGLDVNLHETVERIKSWGEVLMRLQKYAQR